jgi:hypothetical protein
MTDTESELLNNMLNTPSRLSSDNSSLSSYSSLNSTPFSQKQLLDFNDQFEKEKEINKIRGKQNQEETLSELSEKENIPETPFYKKNVYDILIAIKDTWFFIIDDLVNKPFSFDIFYKNNRLFYIGLTICIIALLFILYDLIKENFGDDTENNNNKKVEIHHIYHYPTGSEKNITKSITDTIVKDL